MLTQVAPGVLVHTSAFCRSNAVVVEGSSGVLLVDPGVLEDELVCLAADLRERGTPVVAGFSTHPHWDHLLWHADLGDVPRWITTTGLGVVRARLSDDGARARVATMLPPEHADQIPLELLGLVTALDADATEVPWDGPRVRVLEHQGHAPGHAALLVEGSGVLLAGDTLSDVLVPLLNTMGAEDPVNDYLAGLDLLDGLTGVEVVVPGHGSVGDASALPARVEQDRAYLRGGAGSDPRVVAPQAGWEWVAGVHERQAQHLTT